MDLGVLERCGMRASGFVEIIGGGERCGYSEVRACCSFSSLSAFELLGGAKPSVTRSYTTIIYILSPMHPRFAFHLQTHVLPSIPF